MEPYRIVRKLGTGGMAEVFEAEHVELGVRRALKIFNAGDSPDGENLRRRFLAEGRLLARFDHPRLVKVHDLGTDAASGNPYLAMDLVLGPEGAPCTLADVQKSGGIDEERLSGWYEDVRAALAVLHKAGVVHRDIKPENVLIGPDGHAVLADFGVSRVMDASLRAEISLTRTTTVDADSGRRTLLGTMAYLAPEVRAGGEPTPASDCWAMGVRLFRLLTGMWYWDPDAINAKLLLQPFDARWERLFARLLASDPAQRALPPFGGDHRLTLRRVGIACAALAALALVGFVVWRFTAAPPVPDVDNLYVLPE